MILDLKKMIINKKGFSLIEVLGVISIITIGLIGVISLVIQNIRVEQINKNFLVASMLSQEGLELVRNIRDKNWLSRDANGTRFNWKTGDNVDYPSVFVYSSHNPNTDILQESKGYSYAIDYTGQIYPSASARLYVNASEYYTHINTSPNQATLFSRLISVVDNEDYIIITSTVEWNERGKSYDYTTETHLYNWR